MKKPKFAAEDAVRAIAGNENERVCEDGTVLMVENDGEEMVLVAHDGSSKEEWFHASDLELVTFVNVPLHSLKAGDRFSVGSFGSWLYVGAHHCGGAHRARRVNGESRSFSNQTVLVQK